MPRVSEQPSNENPKVSVHMITYNHVNFIAEGIESVLRQETEFPVELVIGEDCSTDGTRSVVQKYAEKFPNVIRTLLPDQTLGMHKNFAAVRAACRGEFVALLEGDDYWTDTAKLEKQFAFLADHPDFSICFHNCTIWNKRDGKDQKWVFPQDLKKDVFETEDILGPWFIPTASILFRNYHDFKLPSWFENCQSGDIPFLLLMSLRGKIKYLNANMSVWRLHGGGVSASHSGYSNIIGMTYIYESFNAHTQYKYKAKVQEAIIAEIKPRLKELQKISLPRPVLWRRVASRIRGLWMKPLGPLRR
jgi:glycosyltransferase involved in cell wall biosynthesis